MTEKRGDLSDLLLILIKRRRFIILNTLVVSLLALGATFLMTPRFTAMTTLFPPKSEGEGLMNLSSLLQRFDISQLGLTGATTSAQVYVAILKSRTLTDLIVRDFDLVDHYEVKKEATARRLLIGSSDVGLSSTGVIQISVTDDDPALAARLANAYVAGLDSLNQVLRTGEGRRSRVFVEERLTATRERLRAAEDSLLAFQERHPGLAIPPDVAASAGAAADLMARRITLGYEMDLLQTTLQPGAAPLVRKEEELRALDRQLGQIPSLGMDMGRLYRDFKVQEKVFELLSAQLESARIREAKDVTTVDVLDVAVPPDRRSFPRRGLITGFAFLLSFLLAVVVAVSLDVMERLRVDEDPRFRSAVPPGSLLDRLLFHSHKSGDD